MSKTLSNLIVCATLLATPSAAMAQKQKPKATPETEAGMVPMDQVGPRPIGVNPKSYAQLVRVSADEKHKSVSSALVAITDASPSKRYAVVVAGGMYNEVRLAMKPYVDLYGGFAPDWKKRDVYQYASVLDAQKKGPVVVGADHARLDGFVVTGGEQKGHGGGIVCDGTSPILVNNIIVGNRTLKIDLKEGAGKQIGNEGAGIALMSGSRAYVANNLICENTTEIGNAAGLSARGNVQAVIVRNVFCNNISGEKDNSLFHGKVGSRSSPGAAISCCEESSPQISFNVIVLGAALFKNDAGGIWVEGNSTPAINFNWIVGNTSYDDGGGIYVMGNLYYDEEGKRFDFMSDRPVAIENNVIAGNSSIYGGPGGIRVSRFGRVELRRNRIVANNVGGAQGREGGVICVSENNVIADNGQPREKGKKKPREAPKPSFRLTNDIASRKFDPQRFVTEITTSKPLRAEDLEGGVVRIGAQWSVIKSSGPSSLVVWGKITDTATKIEVLQDYLAKK
jgi:hypothetical protein